MTNGRNGIKTPFLYRYSQKKPFALQATGYPYDLLVLVSVWFLFLVYLGHGHVGFSFFLFLTISW